MTSYTLYETTPSTKAELDEMVINFREFEKFLIEVLCEMNRVINTNEYIETGRLLAYNTSK